LPSLWKRKGLSRHASALPLDLQERDGNGQQADGRGEEATCHKRNGYRFSVISGTILKNTNYRLRVWFQVMFLMAHSKKGMSVLQIKRTVFHDKASYETVWYMCTRISAAMKDDQFSKLMDGVEVEETYIGGKKQKPRFEQETGRTRPTPQDRRHRRNLAQGQCHLSDYRQNFDRNAVEVRASSRIG
jgi:hypothetical protein